MAVLFSATNIIFLSYHYFFSLPRLEVRKAAEEKADQQLTEMKKEESENNPAYEESDKASSDKASIYSESKMSHRDSIAEMTDQTSLRKHSVTSNTTSLEEAHL